MTFTPLSTLSSPGAPPTRTRQIPARFCRLTGCANLLFGKAADFCSEGHRHYYHTTARLVGHGVIQVAGFEEAEKFRGECVKFLERGNRVAVNHADMVGSVHIRLQPPRPEQIDMNSMTPRERLMLLCRAAKTLGVLPEKWAGRGDGDGDEAGG